MSVGERTDDLAAVSALDDPVRARLYAAVSSSPEPVGRDLAAQQAGVGRALAAYHLDKLVEAGLLVTTYRRPEGRGGPGAGRPAKLYSRSERAFAVSVPPREYEMAAFLLAGAVGADESGTSHAALCAAARAFGVDLGRGYVASAGASDEPLIDVLERYGYEPWRDTDGVVRLRNCPFRALAERYPDVVCAMNAALIEGIDEGLPGGRLRPALDPSPGCCCVTARRAS